MTSDLDPRDDLTDRLRALGQRPVDPALQSEHLTALAGVRSGSAFRTALVGRAKVAAGVMAGFLIGATGLTTAGAMGPLQPIAATAIERATPLNGLPESASDKAKAKGLERAAKNHANGTGAGAGGEKIWGVDGCPAEGEFKNRGLFLKAAKDEVEAAGMTFAEARESDCGKAVGGGDDAGATEAPKPEDTEGDEPKGKETAPGLDEDAQRGQSEDKKPESPGKSDEAPEGAKPESTPAVPEVADEHADDATEDVEGADPGEAPADPEAKPQD